METIRVIKSQGGTVISGFAIKAGPGGALDYSFNTDNPELFKSRKEKWLENMFLNLKKYYDKPAAEVIDVLCERYQVPADISPGLRHQLLSVWQEVSMQSYQAYLPVVIAYNVTFQTVAELLARADALDGVQVGQTTQRYYPRADSMAQVIGYTGRMNSEDMLAKYTDKSGIYRYAPSDTVGLAGLESTYEDQLSGNLYSRQGQRVVEVNNRRSVTRELSYTPQQNGNDITLTINADLQRVAEAALAENIAVTRAYQQNLYAAAPAKYDAAVAERGGRAIDYAAMGACVVMDVRTGEVLALANYPNYDLNLFVGGISQTEYDKLLSDPGMPLFNKAVASRAHPGSIFKMVPGFAALAGGYTTLNETISDDGEYTKHLAEGSTAVGPRCWLRWGYEEAHKDQDLIAALKNSCNYYFYELGNRMGIEHLRTWAHNFGLDELSGINLDGELKSQVAGPTSLYDPNRHASQQTSNDAQMTYQRLTAVIKGMLEKHGIAREEAEIVAAVSDMMIAATDPTKSQDREVIRILEQDLQLPRAILQAEDAYEQCKNELYQILWTKHRTLMACIGQETTLITPIAAARYAAAIANGGWLYEAHLVKEIRSPSGELEFSQKPTVERKLTDPQYGLTPAYFAAVKEGMREVVSAEEGTGGQYFKDFRYLNEIAGKTGTAQVSKIDIEQNAWFVGFAPFDSPEIAVVVYIPNGSAGARNHITAEAVFGYWLDQRDTTQVQGVTKPQEVG